MRTMITGKTFDEERSLYHLQNADVTHCVFAGPADGESALKECRDVCVRDCRFSLRYPLWHAQTFRLVDSSMDTLTRAPIWYANDGRIQNCTVEGIKCLRECEQIDLQGCSVHSPEFGWKCRGLSLSDCDVDSEYFLFECRDVAIDRLHMAGKYSFQYIQNMQIKNSVLDTKDAFWHSENVTVENSTIKGEYLGWYSNGLTLINCRIIGTQPLCYCRNLRLINCTMESTDLAFEYSEVEADIAGGILSIKNPLSGRITADAIEEIVLEDAILSSTCQIQIRSEEGRHQA